jgi:hypothetical protein
MTQWLLAALLISLATVYAAWLLMPAAWQLRGLQALERRLAAGTAPVWLRQFVSRRAAARLSAGGGCGSCPSAPAKREP